MQEKPVIISMAIVFRLHLNFILNFVSDKGEIERSFCSLILVISQNMNRYGFNMRS